MRADLLISNRSNLPDDHVRRLVHFAADRTQIVPIPKTYVRVRAGEGGGRWYWGTARPAYSRNHGCVFTVAISSEVGSYFRVPHVCYHASAWKEWPRAELYDEIARLYERGEREWKRWPIRAIETADELIVHLAAHELMHVVQKANRRKLSEIECERFSALVLDEWREQGIEAVA